MGETGNRRQFHVGVVSHREECRYVSHAENVKETSGRKPLLNVIGQQLKRGSSHLCVNYTRR